MKGLFLILGLSISTQVFAQKILISGKVTDFDGQPLSEVQVSVRNSDEQTTTDDQGQYELEIPESAKVIQFRHPKMKPASATIGLTNIINITMVDKGSEELSDVSLEDLMNIKIDVASSKSENIFNTVSTVTVIDRNTIDNYNFENIQEAIQTVAGIEIYRTYIKRNLPTARGVVQDHYANKVLVMINNIPTWHAVTGEGCIDRVNINDVERIEILKGPSSVLYGTNAYSGAINIVLKKEASTTSTSYAKIGSGGYLSIGSQVVLNKEGQKLMVSANIEDAKGTDYEFTDEQGNTGTIKEYLNTRNITANWSNDNNNVLLNYYEADESYLGVTPNFSGGAGNPHNLKGLLAAFRTKYPLTQNLNLNYLFEYDWNNRDLSRNANDDVRARIDGYRINNQANIEYLINDMVNLEAGTSWEFRQSNKYENYNVLTDSALASNNLMGISLNVFSAFGQFNYQSDKFNLTLGTRYSHNELFNSNLSSRLTFVYKFNPQNSLKVLYGESFRAPSLFEQNFTTSSMTVVGNPDLEPEKSKTFEIGYLKSFENLFVQLTGYYAGYENKIFRELTYYPPADANVNVYANGKTFNATGLEAEIKYMNPDLFNAFLNLNYIAGTDGDKIDDHFNFKYVPKFSTTLGLQKSVDKFNFSLIANTKSPTEGPSGEIRSMIRLDLNTGYKHKFFGKQTSHSLSVKNLADTGYDIPEYVRLRTVNSIPSGYGRRIVYMIKVML